MPGVIATVVVLFLGLLVAVRVRRTEDHYETVCPRCGCYTVSDTGCTSYLCMLKKPSIAATEEPPPRGRRSRAGAPLEEGRGQPGS